jgi:hypothetical protein
MPGYSKHSLSAEQIVWCELATSPRFLFRNLWRNLPSFVQGHKLYQRCPGQGHRLEHSAALSEGPGYGRRRGWRGTIPDPNHAALTWRKPSRHGIADIVNQTVCPSSGLRKCEVGVRPSGAGACGMPAQVVIVHDDDAFRSRAASIMCGGSHHRMMSAVSE